MTSFTENYENISESGRETDAVETAAALVPVDAPENELYVKFKKPFRFEGDFYDGIDLSGLEDLTAKDLGEIEKKFYKLGITSFNPENTSAYSLCAAQVATGMPVEFFDQLPACDVLAIRRTVVNFFFA